MTKITMGTSISFYFVFAFLMQIVVFCDTQAYYARYNNNDAKNPYEYASEYVRRAVRTELDEFKQEMQALIRPDRQTGHMLTRLSQDIQSMSQRLQALLDRQSPNALSHQLEQRFQTWFNHLENMATSGQGQCQSLERGIRDLSNKVEYLKSVVTRNRQSSNQGYAYGVEVETQAPAPAQVVDRSGLTGSRPEGSRSSGAVFAGSYYDQRRATQLEGKRVPEDLRITGYGKESRDDDSKENEVVYNYTPRPYPTQRPYPTPAPAPSPAGENKNRYSWNRQKQNYWNQYNNPPTKPTPTPVRYRPAPTIEIRKPIIAKPYEYDRDRNRGRGYQVAESRRFEDRETDSHEFVYPKYFESPSPTPPPPVTPKPYVNTYKRNRNWSYDTSRRSYKWRWEQQNDDEDDADEEEEDDWNEDDEDEDVERIKSLSTFQAHEQYDEGENTEYDDDDQDDGEDTEYDDDKGTCPSSVTGLGERETLRTALDTIIGAWMKDTGENNGKVWAVEGSNAINWRNILEYTSEHNFEMRISSEYHELPEACVGLGAVVYKDHLYCQVATSNKNKAEIIKYSFEDQRVVARGRLEPPGGSSLGVPYRGWAGIYLHLQIMVDEKGMWVISGESHTKRLVIFSIDPDTLDILHVYRTSQSKDSIGPAFMVCGKLYATDSHYAVSVRYTYDTNTRQEKTIPKGQFTFPFMDLITIQYNPMDRKLYGWQVSRKEHKKNGRSFHRSRGPKRKLYGLADRIEPKFSSG